MDIDRVNRVYAKLIKLIDDETKSMNEEETAVLLDGIANEVGARLEEIEGNIGDEDE